MLIRDYKDDPYLSLLRPLVEAYLAFYRVGNRHIQSLGLTPGQFDVIAELEGTKGLTCAQLSEQTLTTKGTLTGVLDRLEHRGLIQRGNVGGDRRATRVQLTSKGIDMFQNVFPVHAEFMRPFFAQALNASEVQVAKRLLRRVRDSFNGPMSVPKVELPRMENSSINLRTSKTSQNPDKKLRLSRKTKVQKN
jgi:MarR family 2-MHQ and catechol resistance regulon transcriptional repressor